jgi:UMF1 family MFS transporter
MFLVFSLPLFLFVPDRQRHAPLKFNFLTIGLERVRSTFREFAKYKSVARFLLAYFLYIDAVNTIIVFSSIFADETLKLGVEEIILFFAIVQSSAVAGSLLFGMLADKIGHKRSLIISLYLWLVILVLAYFVMDKMAFFGVGVLAGVALGSSQSASRSLMSSLIPPEKKTEFFGFYSFFGKASAIIGPALFGVVSSNVNQRAALLSVSVLLIAGMILLRRVESR